MRLDENERKYFNVKNNDDNKEEMIKLIKWI